ncbi:MAG: glycosyltransferase family 4 protein [Candidatus Sumerlaeaceae bacterium]|nr:glycosyltransferase family 4 protein [Candidatus Sumerlaeaceae bacterium]
MKPLPRKLAFVTPWYGSGKGGAEVFCGGIAAALGAIGRDVEIITTCCRDPFHDWGENHLPPGLTHDGPVPVRRFKVRPRNADLYAQLYNAMNAGTRLTPTQEDQLLANSINSDDLVAYISAHRNDTVFFFLPYLYGTTFSGLRAARSDAAFLIPCLHNEPMAYLPAIQRMFRRATACLFLSQPERDLAATLYEISAKPELLLGGGIRRDSIGDATRFRKSTGIEGPFVLSVGRKVPGKGADLLMQHFGRYLALNPDEDLKLVMVGGGQLEIPANLWPRIFSITLETAQEVYDAMAACEFLIHPSLYESFSIVIMEAWLNNKAVLVNGECEVTLYHVLKSRGGLYFANFGEFSEAVRMLRQQPDARAALGAAGRRYVAENYTWHDTALRLHNFLASLEPRPETVPVQVAAPPAGSPQ